MAASDPRQSLDEAYRAARSNPDGEQDLRAALRNAVKAAAIRVQRRELHAAWSLTRRILEIEPDNAEALHLLGVVQGEYGRNQEALALIGKAIALNPDFAPYHLNQGLLYGRLGRHQEALTHYEAVTRLLPESSDSWEQLGSALKRVGRYYDAIVAWERAWALAPGDGRLYHLLWAAYQELQAGALPADRQLDGYIAAIACGNAARAQGQIATAESLYRAAMGQRPQSPFARSQLACLLATARRYGEADECFQLLARKFRYPNGVIRLDKGFVAALEDGRGNPRYPRFQGTPGTTDKPAVVLVAGDAGYFRTYAYALVNSLQANGRLDCLIHVHVVNPDEFIAGEIELIRRELRCPDLAYTFEHVVFPAGEEQKHTDGTYSVRTYHACSRFLQLPVLLAHYARPVLMLDMDVLIVNDLRPLLAAAQSADGGLIALDPNTQHVWDEMYATLIYLRPTPRTRGFVARVADYIWHYVARGELHWGLDQIAWYAVSAVGNAADVPVFHEFSARAVQGKANFRPGATAPEYDPDACIWTITASMPQNRGKLDSPEYRRYLPRVKSVYGWFTPGTDRVVEIVLKDAPSHNGRRVWEADLQRACFERVRRRRRALDIGAHIGTWSWALAERFDRVDAFEPHPLLQHCWRRNVVAGNAVLHATALGNERKRMRLSFNWFNAGMTHLVDEGDGAETEVRRLDELELDDVDFIKLDAEGYEYFILQGGAQTLARCRPLVLLEQTVWNERYGVSGSAALRYLESLGARVIVQLRDSDFLMGWS